MKKILSKNSIIVLLIGSNVAFAAYIFNDKIKLLLKMPKATKREAVVQPVSFLKNDNELQICYEAFLASQPTVDEGTVVFHMMLNERGSLDFLELAHSDLDDEGFTSCLLDKIQKKRYPVAADRVGVMIAQKLNFYKKSLTTMNFERQ